MRVLVDYRPALRARSGVGEWVHQLSRAILAARHVRHPAARDVELSLFTSSWADRPSAESLADLDGATLVDRRIPNRLLTWSWNRLNWPAVEDLVPFPVDLVHSPNPVAVPSRSAARVITVHDLDFLDHPERTRDEMRHDYPRLSRAHAVEADLVVAVSAYTAGLVRDRLGVEPARVVVCRAGRPGWIDAQPDVRTRPPGQRHILFVGTLEPRKNIPGLLDAYERLLSRGPVPPLVLAGSPTAEAHHWLARIRESRLAGQVEVRGYVAEPDKPSLYRDAVLVVLPSFEEGFGLPALEAMAMGVPVVASRVGAIPEVVGDAALLVPPGDSEALADMMSRVLSEEGLAADLRARGLARAQTFDWMASACSLLESFREVVARRSGRDTRGGRR